MLTILCAQQICFVASHDFATTDRWRRMQQRHFSRVCCSRLLKKIQMSLKGKEVKKIMNQNSATIQYNLKF